MREWVLLTYSVVYHLPDFPSLVQTLGPLQRYDCLPSLDRLHAYLDWWRNTLIDAPLDHVYWAARPIFGDWEPEIIKGEFSC